MPIKKKKTSIKRGHTIAGLDFKSPKELSISQMTMVYNVITDSCISHFQDRATGIRRLTQALKDY